MEVNASEVEVGQPLLAYVEKRRLKEVVAAKLNGRIYDLHTPIPAATTPIQLLTIDDKEALDVLRHSTAHIMADAVQKLFPGAKVTIGPAIDSGFYYDFDYEPGFTAEDLEKIEAKMRGIIQQKYQFQREVIDRSKARQIFAERGEPFKVELVDAIPQGEEITFYKHEGFFDLCQGPHIPNTGFVKGFKLTHTAGAYWRGDEHNKMLRRIYGTAFFSDKALKEHFAQLEEAKKRDHRKLGKDLELFGFHPWAPASPFFLPKGTIIYNELVELMRQVYKVRGYDEVISPQIFDTELYHKSGHYENYRDNMYFATTHADVVAEEDAKREFSLKPMNCPGHCLMYGMHRHSYRELPIRMADFGRLHRFERSGVTAGLTRVRTFCQDDAHIFCTLEQLDSEMLAFIDLCRDVYTIMGIPDFSIALATRPEKSIGNDDMWRIAESALEKALVQRGIAFTLNPGEGAFYGPKIEFHIKDALGRSWQLGTLQVDFANPERFDLTYVSADNNDQRPVMLHRAIFGSLERFIGVYLEHTGGNLPMWLAPEQIRLVTITDEQIPFANDLLEKLLNLGMRATLDRRGDKLGAKIRDAQLLKIPYAGVLGHREVEEGKVALRRRGGEDLGALPVEQAVSLLAKEAARPVLPRSQASLK